MNRYIRTKDEIYKRREDTYIEDNILYLIGFDFGRLCLGEVIKQADTIEELCDELVVAYKDCCEKRTYLYSGTIQEFKENRPNYKNKFFTYYGAVWCDKGLIFVAKLDDKGELVLI